MFGRKTNKLAIVVPEPIQKKSFSDQLIEASRVFTETIEKIKDISSGITSKMDENNEKMKELTMENEVLSELKNKANKQIEQIGQLI